jgi:hypothetical protein
MQISNLKPMQGSEDTQIKLRSGCSQVIELTLGQALLGEDLTHLVAGQYLGGIKKGVLCIAVTALRLPSSRPRMPLA